jgi:preprotein translocase subunit YajC
LLLCAARRRAAWPPGAAADASRALSFERAALLFLPLLETPLFISSAFAQTAPAAGGSDMMSSLGSMLPLVLMFVVLYFVMIRPQMKRQKEHRNLVAGLSKGDEVVTNGGIAGRVDEVGESFITVEIAPNVKIKLQKGAVQQVLPKGTLKSS